jgi:NhaA family Na+:H+ antiporter
MVTTQRPRPSSALRDFLRKEAAGGILLMGAAALALVIANSPLGHLYHDLLHAPTGPVLTEKLGPMSAHLWINDLLMAVFFLLVGLEIKRELVDGRLSTWDQRRPAGDSRRCRNGAAGGVLSPPRRRRAGPGGGLGDPAATDIAFAIGVLALLGRRAPTSLKLFLTTVAIADDLGAVAIIAVAYTASIDTLALGVAAGIYLTMYAMGKSGVTKLWIFMIGAACLWYAVLLSGVHATVAGVLAATTIPIVKTPGTPDAADSPLHRLEHGLAPWVAFLIVPLFGFANAASTCRIGMDRVFAPLPRASRPGCSSQGRSASSESSGCACGSASPAS